MILVEQFKARANLFIRIKYLFTFLAPKFIFIVANAVNCLLLVKRSSAFSKASRTPALSHQGWQLVLHKPWLSRIFRRISRVLHCRYVRLAVSIFCKAKKVTKYWFVCLFLNINYNGMSYRVGTCRTRIYNTFKARFSSLKSHVSDSQLQRKALVSAFLQILVCHHQCGWWSGHFFGIMILESTDRQRFFINSL